MAQVLANTKNLRRTPPRKAASRTRKIHILAFSPYAGAPTRVHIVVYNTDIKQVVTFLDGLM